MVASWIVGCGRWGYDPVWRFTFGLALFRDDKVGISVEPTLSHGGGIALRGEHSSLQLIGSETFEADELHRVVTFLNQCLKGHGFVFGLAKQNGAYSLRVYQGRPDAEEEDTEDR
jgi:hypothetical protein